MQSLIRYGLVALGVAAFLVLAVINPNMPRIEQRAEAQNTAGSRLNISEFRFNGPDPTGSQNEFIEIHNPGAGFIVGTTPSGDATLSSNQGGIGVFASTGNGTSSNTVTLVCRIPDGFVIPAGGYVLCTNPAGYTMNSHGSFGAFVGGPTDPGLIAGFIPTAVGNFPIINGTGANPGIFTSVDIPNDAGLALINVGDNTVVNTADTATDFGFAATGVSAAQLFVFDRVGFGPYGAGAPLQPGCHLTSGECGPSGSTRPSLADNFCEGGTAGCLRPVGDASVIVHGSAPFYGDSGEYSIMRRQALITGSTEQRDTNNNGDDFILVAPRPGTNVAANITGVTGVNSVLGGAGPQNNAAPPDLSEASLAGSLFDPSKGQFAGPNAERIWSIDTIDTKKDNNPVGTLILRFGFTNPSIVTTIRELRFRLDNAGVPCIEPTPSPAVAVAGSGQARNLRQATPNCQQEQNAAGTPQSAQTAVVKLLNERTKLVARETGTPEIVRGSVVEETSKPIPGDYASGAGINSSLVRTTAATTVPGTANPGEFSGATLVPASSKFFLGIRFGVVKGGFLRFVLQQEGSSATPTPAPTVTP